MPRSTKFMLTAPETAARLGRVTGVVAFALPAGFHVLPRPEQKRLVHEQLSRAMENVEDAIDRDLVPAA